MFDFDQFFSLGSAFERDELIPAPEDDSADPFALVAGEQRIDVPRVYRRHMGKFPKDFMFAADLTVLVHDRVVALLQENHVTGWATFPVEVYRVAGQRLDGYHGLIVTGRALIDDARSELSILPPRVPEASPRKAWMGLYFDPVSWDGSDMFLLKGTRFIIATRRVKLLAEEAKLSDVMFEPLAQIENHRLTWASDERKGPD